MNIFVWLGDLYSIKKNGTPLLQNTVCKLQKYFSSLFKVMVTRASIMPDTVEDVKCVIVLSYYGNNKYGHAAM